MKNKKLKAVIAICLAIVIGIGIFIWYNPEAMPNLGSKHQDAINLNVPNNNQNKDSNTTGNAGMSPSNNSGVLRDSVTILDEKQSLDIQSKIDSIECKGNSNYLLTYKQLPQEISKEKIGSVIFIPFVKGQYFPETYIAKIDDVKQESGKYTVSISTPGIDEVFDNFDLNIDSVLTKDKLQSVETLPGVKLSYEKNDYDKLLLSSKAQKQQYGLQSLVYKSNTKDKTPPVSYVSNTSSADEPLSLVFEMKDLDLTKLYHIYKQDGKEDKAIDTKNMKATLSGKIGVNNIRFYHVVEYGIQYPMFFNNLIVGATADQVAEVTLDGNAVNMDFDDVREVFKSKDKKDDKDEADKEKGLFQLQGLEENTFPLAHLVWNVGTVRVTKPYDIKGGIKEEELVAPLSIGLVLSIDVEGNATIKISGQFNQTIPFDSQKRQLMKNGIPVDELIGPIGEDKEKKTDWKVSLDASGDMDLQVINLNIGAYLFNLNFTRFTLTCLGAEAEGEAKFEISTRDGPSLDTKGHMSIYSSLLWKTNLSVKAKDFLSSKRKYSDLLTIGFTRELWRKNWLERGELLTTFDKDTMGYNAISAYDDKYIYYKDITGCLSRVRKDNTDITKVMPDDFFIICAIDKSFIYVLKKEPSGDSFKICRINKEESSCRDIADNIQNCIMQDDKYLYIVPADNKNKVQRIDKRTLITSDLTSVDKGNGGLFGGDNIVQALYDRNDNEYLLISKEDSWLNSDTHYYIVDKKSGKTTSVPREYQYFYRDKFDSYTAATNMKGAGFLRGTADEVYWESKDGTNRKQIKGLSGWCPIEQGIFTQNNNDDEATKQQYPYVITLARASDGEIQNVWKTVSRQAFFTLQNYKDKWYFIDQTPKEYILYMAKDINTEPQAIKRFPISDYNVGLDKCSTSMCEGILFFYSIDGTNSKLLYRYDLNGIDSNVK